jgi:hypothetical protein
MFWVKIWDVIQILICYFSPSIQGDLFGVELNAAMLEKQRNLKS